MPSIDVETPLLRDREPDVPSSLSRRLYISHFLSTWNSRVFEFGAVLYLASIYPGRLLPMSIYAFARGLSAVLFSPLVGLYIDTGSRIQVVQVSIVGQRVVVATSCAIFYFLSTAWRDQLNQYVALALVSLLACIEKLCSIMNTVSVEKDWVVVVANGNQKLLTALNAQMRRIDLVCKLFGPFVIAMMDGYSTQVAILTNLGMNLASAVIEYFAIVQVYIRCPKLQEPKGNTTKSSSLIKPNGTPEIGRSGVGFAFTKTISDFKLYMTHRAFVPSFTGAMLYLTVLSFGGQMVTYLLASGYGSVEIGVSRTIGVIFEMGSTWAAPWMMARAGPVNAGFWMSLLQISMLVPTTVVFWVFVESPIVSASGLVVGTILSRFGLRGFDLCMQVIVQNEVEEDIRGAFSSVEAGFQNAFELLSYVSTMVFSRPEEFKWPALISMASVTIASMSYTVHSYRKQR